jgi:hypothetical protein
MLHCIACSAAAAAAAIDGGCDTRLFRETGVELSLLSRHFTITLELRLAQQQHPTAHLLVFAHCLALGCCCLAAEHVAAQLLTALLLLPALLGLLLLLRVGCLVMMPQWLLLVVRLHHHRSAQRSSEGQREGVQ